MSCTKSRLKRRLTEINTPLMNMMYVYFPVHYIRFWLSVTVRAVVDVVGRDAVLCVKRIAILSNS